MMTPQKKTVAAASRHQKLVHFVVSSYGALIAAYNSIKSAVFKIADIADGSTDSWATIIKVEVGPRFCCSTEAIVIVRIVIILYYAKSQHKYTHHNS